MSKELNDLATARRLIAEAEARAQAAEADAAYMRFVLLDYVDARRQNDQRDVTHWEQVLYDIATKANLGAALLAELEAARTVVAAVRNLQINQGWVVWEPLTAAIDAYDAARGRAGAEREG